MRCIFQHDDTRLRFITVSEAYSTRLEEETPVEIGRNGGAVLDAVLLRPFNQVRRTGLQIVFNVERVHSLHDPAINAVGTVAQSLQIELFFSELHTGYVTNHVLQREEHSVHPTRTRIISALQSQVVDVAKQR